MKRGESERKIEKERMREKGGEGKEERENERESM